MRKSIALMFCLISSCAENTEDCHFPKTGFEGVAFVDSDLDLILVLDNGCQIVADLNADQKEDLEQYFFGSIYRTEHRPVYVSLYGKMVSGKNHYGDPVQKFSVGQLVVKQELLNAKNTQDAIRNFSPEYGLICSDEPVPARERGGYCR